MIGFYPQRKSPDSSVVKTVSLGTSSRIDYSLMAPDLMRYKASSALGGARSAGCSPARPPIG